MRQYREMSSSTVQWVKHAMKQWNLNAMSGATMLKCRSKIVGLKMPLESVGHGDICCVPLGSETRIYEFPSRKYRSIEVGSRISKWETRNSARTPTSDLEIWVSEPNGMQQYIHTDRQRDTETDRQTNTRTDSVMWLNVIGLWHFDE